MAGHAHAVAIGLGAAAGAERSSRSALRPYLTAMRTACPRSRQREFEIDPQSGNGRRARRWAVRANRLTGGRGRRFAFCQSAATAFFPAADEGQQYDPGVADSFPGP